MMRAGLVPSGFNPCRNGMRNTISQKCRSIVLRTKTVWSTPRLRRRVGCAGPVRLALRCGAGSRFCCRSPFLRLPFRAASCVQGWAGG